MAFEEQEDMPSSESQIISRASASTLGLPQMTLDELRTVARSIPFEWGYVGLSLIQARLWEVSQDGPAQLGLLREIYGDVPLLEEYESFLAGHSPAALFGPQDLYVAQRLLIDEARDADFGTTVTFDDDVAFSTLLIHAPGIVDAASPLDLTASQPSLLQIVATMQQGATVSARPAPLNELGRFYDVFAVRARESVNDLVPLDLWAQEDFNLTLEQQIAGGYGYGAMAKRENGATQLGLVASSSISTTKLGPVEGHVIAALSGDRESFRAEFADGDQTERDVAWEVFPFIRRPFLRLADGRLVLSSPSAISNWTGFGIYDRLRLSARKRPHKGGTKLDVFGQVVGDLVEDYAVDVARSVYPAGRVFSDADWTAVQAPDVAIAHGRDLVLIEVRSGFLSPWFRTSGELDEFEKQMKRHVYDKIEQLGNCVREIDAVAAAVGDLDLSSIERIWPVLVTVPLMITEHFWLLIDDKIPASLRGGHVQHLVVTDMQEFELLMGAVERGGDIIEILEARQQTPYKLLELARWLTEVAGVPSTCRPKLVEQNWERASAALRDTLWDDAVPSDTPAA